MITSVLLVVMVTAVRDVIALTTAEKAEFDAIGKVTFTESGSNYVISSTGIPVHDTGDFPNTANPNRIQNQSYSFTVKQTPTEAASERCLPMGTVGLAINGVPFFNPYTLEGNNAVEGTYAEEFDTCDGHPAPMPAGAYHCHKTPSCLLNSNGVALESWPGEGLAGIALDGYPIYGPKFANGTTVHSRDLDRCHGTTIDGQYRYYLTPEFPYVAGCFHGDVVDTGVDFNRHCSFATADDYVGAGDGNVGNALTAHMTALPALATVGVTLLYAF